MKSWFAGGKCRIATDIETAHIFKARGSHFTEPWDLIYNKIAIATILFSDDVRDAMLDFIGYNHPNEAVFVARELIEKDREFIEKCRDDFRKIKKINIHDFRKIFPFKDYGALEEL